MTLAIDLLTLNGCRKIFVTWSNTAPTLSVLRSCELTILSYDVHDTSYSLLGIAHDLFARCWHNDINHNFEFPDPYLPACIHVAMCMALCRRFIRQSQSMLKAKNFTAHAVYHYHVTCRQSARNNHIFGIPPQIAYSLWHPTWLQWRIRLNTVLALEIANVKVKLSENFAESHPKSAKFWQFSEPRSRLKK